MTREASYIFEYEADVPAEVKIRHIKYSPHPVSFSVEGKGRIKFESFVSFRPTAFDISTSAPVKFTGVSVEFDGEEKSLAIWKQTINGVDLDSDRSVMINKIGFVKVDVGDNLYGWDISSLRKFIPMLLTPENSGQVRIVAARYIKSN